MVCILRKRELRIVQPPICFLVRRSMASLRRLVFLVLGIPSLLRRSGGGGEGGVVVVC